MDKYNETKMIMKQYNIVANKHLGQNFLIDDEALDTIVESTNISKEDLIIEIGPGLGTLTEELLKKAGKVISIELDKRMIQILNNRFSIYKNFECINNDVLKINFKNLIEENKKGNIKKVKIVANLPYYITTPIIMKLLENRLDIELITVMVQKEVADRLVTEPGKGDTGAITYAIRYFTNPTTIMQVKNTAFIPAPEVNSTVIQFELLKTPQVEVKSEKTFFKVIKLAFMQRRKTLLNSLSNSGVLGERMFIEKMLNDLEIDVKIRPEKLSINDFANITNYIENHARKEEK